MALRDRAAIRPGRRGLRCRPYRLGRSIPSTDQSGSRPNLGERPDVLRRIPAAIRRSAIANSCCSFRRKSGGRFSRRRANRAASAKAPLLIPGEYVSVNAIRWISRTRKHGPTNSMDVRTQDDFRLGGRGSSLCHQDPRPSERVRRSGTPRAPLMLDLSDNPVRRSGTPRCSSSGFRAAERLERLVSRPTEATTPRARRAFRPSTGRDRYGVGALYTATHPCRHAGVPPGGPV